MKKHTLAIITACTAVLLLFFGVNIAIFYHNLETVKESSQKKMLSVAEYMAFLSRKEYKSGIDGDSVNMMLGELTRACGFERTVITDSSGLVFYSSGSIIGRGDHIDPFLVDKNEFKRSVREESPGFSKIVQIDGVYFQSLYYPFTIGNIPSVVVLEADQQYYSALERFKINLIVSSVLLTIAVILLIIFLVFIRKKMEAAIAQSNHNERLAFLGKASAELAHELKNPLGIIKSSVDVLRKKFDPSYTHKAFEFVSDEVMRLSRLIDGMLSFSRERILSKQEIALASRVNGSLDALKSENPDLHIEINIPETISITGDPDAFRQICDNLLRNAVNAAGKNGEISVVYKQDAKEGHLLFIDNGPGIPEQLKKTLFMPFVTGSKTGTGLGLAIVKTLCERSGWQIDFCKYEGKTCFKIMIPEQLWHKSL